MKTNDKQKNLEQILEQWRIFPVANKVFRKDFILEKDSVQLMIYLDNPSPKTLICKCSLNEQEIAKAMEYLENQKDSLV